MGISQSESRTSQALPHAAPERPHYRDAHRYISTCAAPLSECGRCRRELAALLALKLDYDLQAALALPVDTSEVPDATAAEIDATQEIRRLVVQQCFLHRPDFSGFYRGTTASDIFVADDLSAALPLTSPDLRGRGETYAPQPTTHGLRRFFAFARRTRKAAR